MNQSPHSRRVELGLALSRGGIATLPAALAFVYTGVHLSHTSDAWGWELALAVLAALAVSVGRGAQRLVMLREGRAPLFTPDVRRAIGLTAATALALGPVLAFSIDPRTGAVTVALCLIALAGTRVRASFWLRGFSAGLHAGGLVLLGASIFPRAFAGALGALAALVAYVAAAHWLAGWVDGSAGRRDDSSAPPAQHPTPHAQRPTPNAERLAVVTGLLMPLVVLAAVPGLEPAHRALGFGFLAAALVFSAPQALRLAAGPPATPPPDLTNAGRLAVLAAPLVCAGFVAADGGLYPAIALALLAIVGFALRAEIGLRLETED
jgi:hypothetical protein